MGLVLPLVDVPTLEPSVAREIISSAIEIGLLTWLTYVVLRFLHGTRGLAVMKGAGLILLLLILGLRLLGAVTELSFPRLQAAGGVLLPFIGVVLVVLFQPELRTGLTRLSERARGRDAAPMELSDFASTMSHLAREQVGALVIFEQQTGLMNVEESGVSFDASLSGRLLETIFYPRSPLHDGAVIVREGRIVAASCMLPLSESTHVSRDLGTRHRAALGVTEESDAIAVVVSEETGRMSVAHRGLLRTVDGADHLLVTLTDLFEGPSAEPALS